MKSKLLIFSISVIFSLWAGLSFCQTVRLDNYLPRNPVKDGTVDYTKNLQRGLDENLTVQFPDFPILINEKGLTLRNNHTLNFSKYSCLIMKPNSSETYGLLNLINISNVVINSPNLKGDRDKHLGNKGEWGMGINILSSKNISVKNSNISKCWGDGIYVGEIRYNDRPKYNLRDYCPKNIKITGGIITDNRRNGISIVSVNGITIEDIQINNTSGTMPMAGVCIEPNNNSQILENIELRNVTTKRNAEVGLKYVASSFLGKRNKNVSIAITNFEDHGSKVGLYLGGASSKHGKDIKRLNGTIKVVNCNLYDNVEPIRYGSIQKLNPTISVSSLKIFKNKSRVDKKEASLVSELNSRGIKTIKGAQ